MNEEPKPFVPIAFAGIPVMTAEEMRSVTPTGTVTPEAPAPATADRPHHPYSPSSLQSIEACPAYVSRQSDKPHERTIAGTKAHNAADTGEDDISLSDEDASAVAECLDYVADLKTALVNRAGQTRITLGAALNTELPAAEYEDKVQEVNEPYLPIDDEIFSDAESTTAGYADKILVAFDESELDVVDYKFGMWPVTHAEENLQGIAYALGCFKRWPKCQKVRIHFLQPHLNLISTATILRDEIPGHYLRICAVVALARKARLAGDYEMAAPHVPICSFCGKLGECKKALDIALKVGKKFYPLEIPDDITPTQVLNPHQTDLALRLSMVVATWAKSFRTIITDRVIRGDADCPAGFQIVSQSKRELVDMEAYRKAAIKVISAKEFASTLQTTFGAVEKLIAEKAPRGLKKKVVETFQRETEESGCVTRGLPVTFLKAIPAKDKI